MKRVAVNKAVITVVFPDGGYVKWETNPDGPLARDAVAFAEWLAETAERIRTAATTQAVRGGR